MHARAIVLMLAALPAMAQQNLLIGTVQRISGNQIELATAAQLLTVFTDDKSIVWRDHESHAALRPGDRVRVSFAVSFWGRIIATEIQTRSEFSGLVAGQPSPVGFEVLAPNSGALHRVYLSPKTDFGMAAAGIADGDDVFVAGWDLGNGRIDAVSITLYNTDTPVQR